MIGSVMYSRDYGKREDEQEEGQLHEQERGEERSTDFYQPAMIEGPENC